MTQQATTQRLKKYYRSFQYRSASLQIKPEKININAYKLPVFEIKKPITQKNEQRKSKKKLFRSQQNLIHFGKSFSQSLSKIHQSDLNTSIIKQPNPQNQQLQNFATCSYIQSFQQLMESEQKHTYKKKKLGALSFRLDSLKAVSKINRVALPDIIQYENSQFTALDPIRLPINSIKEHIQKTKKEMEDCPNQLKLIRCEIKEFQDLNKKIIQQFDSEFKQGIKKLWSKLRQNSVHHQGFIMRMRREIKELENFLPSFKKQIQNTKNNQLQVQKVIFETAPFELARNQSQQIDQFQDQKKELNQQETYF